MNVVDKCDDVQEGQGWEAEITALSNAEQRIPAKTVLAIRNMMDASVPDSAGKALTSVLNDMLSVSGNERYKALSILSVQASAIGCTTLITDAYACETIWRSLLYNLRILSELDGVPDGNAAEASDIIYDLWRSRANGNIAARTTAVKAAFFWLYDNWENIAHSIASCYALMDINALLDGMSDTEQVRRSMLYAAVAFYNSIAMCQ